MDTLTLVGGPSPSSSANDKDEASLKAKLKLARAEALEEAASLCEKMVARNRELRMKFGEVPSDTVFESTVLSCAYEIRQAK